MKFIGRFLIVIFTKIFQLLPFQFLVLLSNFIGLVFYYLIPIRKKVVIRNLEIAFPDLSKDKIYKLTLKCYKSICRTFFEIIKLKTTSADWLLKNIEIENEELLKKHLNKKESLILLTAHFGNWEYGALTFGMKYNLSFNVLAKKQSNQYVTKYMSAVRTKFGNREIFTGSSVKELYKALLKKEVIGVVGDQRGSKDGPRINFFGRETAIYTGTATLSLKTKTPILVVLVARQKNNKYIAYIEEISFENLQDNHEEKILEINQRYFNILEKKIKEYPEQWFWMHNIWKY